jgi:hypothetical protein
LGPAGRTKGRTTSTSKNKKKEKKKKQETLVTGRASRDKHHGQAPNCISIDG